MSSPDGKPSEDKPESAPGAEAAAASSADDEVCEVEKNISDKNRRPKRRIYSRHLIGKYFQKSGDLITIHIKTPKDKKSVKISEKANVKDVSHA